MDAARAKKEELRDICNPNQEPVNDLFYVGEILGYFSGEKKKPDL